MTTVEIKDFQPDSDLDDVMNIWYVTSLRSGPLCEDTLRRNWLIMRRHIPRSDIFVAVQDGVVVGFVSLIGDYIGALHVSPDSQRRGIGTKLLDHVREKLKECCLTLEVFKVNIQATRFYKKYGFIAVEEKADDYTGLPVIVMRLSENS
ncbi:peptidyl-lysine N-acetyltransferase YiaC-like [Glandiceps talaboti]